MNVFRFEVLHLQNMFIAHFNIVFVNLKMYALKSKSYCYCTLFLFVVNNF